MSKPRTYDEFYANWLDDAIDFTASEYIERFQYYFDTDISEENLFYQEETKDHFYFGTKGGVLHLFKKTHYRDYTGKIIPFRNY